MDIGTLRLQAYALIDALPQDSLELVVSLMRKLAGNVQTFQGDEPLHVVDQSKEEAACRPIGMHNIVTRIGCLKASIP